MTGREWRKIVDQLAAEFGYEVQQKRRGGHLRLVKPGKPFVVCPQSASDRRAVQNLRAQIRRNEAAA